MREPEISCPYLDSAISEIESARKIHEQLRAWGNDWKDQCEEAEREIIQLEKTIMELKAQIEESK